MSRKPSPISIQDVNGRKYISVQDLYVHLLGIKSDLADMDFAFVFKIFDPLMKLLEKYKDE